MGTIKKTARFTTGGEENKIHGSNIDCLDVFYLISASRKFFVFNGFKIVFLRLFVG